MRFNIGPIPDEFEPDESWQPLREPSPGKMQLFALPAGLGVTALIGYCWFRVGLPPLFNFSGQSNWDGIMFPLSVLPLIAVHEFLHVTIYPRFGLSAATMIGVWPERLLFYAYHSERVRRNQMLAVFAMPFVLMTVLPLVLAGCGKMPADLLIWAAWFSTCNAFVSCGDFLGFTLVLSQVPRAAYVQNKGWRTYWTADKPNTSAQVVAPNEL